MHTNQVTQEKERENEEKRERETEEENQENEKKQEEETNQNKDHSEVKAEKKVAAPDEGKDEKLWEDRVITPLSGIPPLGCSPPAIQNKPPRPYDEVDDDDELQFFLEMEN